LTITTVVIDTFNLDVDKMQLTYHLQGLVSQKLR